MKRTFTASLALAAMLVLLAGPTPAVAPAGATAHSCAQGVTSDLTLQADLHCHLRLAASDVTVDLNGHTLHGSITNDFDLPDPWVEGNTIRNGTVDGHIAVVESGDLTISEVTIRNVRAGGHGFAVHAGDATRIIASTFENNDVAVEVWDDFSANVEVRNTTFVGNDVGFRSDAAGNVLRNNRFIDNDTGIRLHHEEGHPRGTVVRSNSLVGNGTGLSYAAVGSVAPDDVEIRQNRFADSSATGMTITVTEDLPPSGIAIVDNRFLRNGRQHGASGLVVEVVAGVPSESPSPEAAEGVTVAGNLAFHNGDYGIFASGVTDGGRNHGKHNTNPQQCEGVDCTPGRR